MASPKQPERGIRSPYRARYRLNIGPAKGMDDSHDPSTVPDEALVVAENVRIHDGIIHSRAGQSKATDVMSGAVVGMIEIDDAGSTGSGRLFVCSHDEVFTDACCAANPQNITLVLNLFKWLTYGKPNARIGFDDRLSNLTTPPYSQVLGTLAIDALVAAGYAVIPGVTSDPTGWSSYDALIVTQVAPAGTALDTDFEAFVDSGKGVALMGSYQPPI